MRANVGADVPGHGEGCQKDEGRRPNYFCAGQAHGRHSRGAVCVFVCVCVCVIACGFASGTPPHVFVCVCARACSHLCVCVLNHAVPCPPPPLLSLPLSLPLPPSPSLSLPPPMPPLVLRCTRPWNCSADCRTHPRGAQCRMPGASDQKSQDLTGPILVVTFADTLQVPECLVHVSVHVRMSQCMLGWRDAGRTLAMYTVPVFLRRTRSTSRRGAGRPCEPRLPQQSRAPVTPAVCCRPSVSRSHHNWP